jgi:hypothetical protein
MSTPAVRASSGSGLAAATASSYESYPSIVPSSINRNDTAGVWATTSAA